MTKTSFLLAGDNISSELEDSLLCKNFDKIESNYNLNTVYRNHNQLLEGITRSSNISTEFKEKFVVDEKFSGQSGSTIVFTPEFPSSFKFVYLSLYLENKPTLTTEYIGDILKFAADFRKKNPNTNLDYMSQAKIIEYLKEENGFDLLEEISLAAEIATDSLYQIEDDKTYYSRHLFYAYPKVFNESYRMAVFYTDPLNDELIILQCLI
ncbi:hypothetical protein [Clostridium sp.]|uniref:hypothetical protein n=1 Tax=Clostridium sp. TaxID=1506 RepID=UPI002FC9F593